ncbi:MAG: peptide deformylase [Thermoanaerobaculia bacterium]
MAVLPIVRMGNPVLRTPAVAVSPAVLAEAGTQQLIDDMVETMNDADGVGLAAPQIGLAWQLFVYEAEDDDDPASGIPLTIVVNPMLEPLAGEPLFDWEGCLSIPDLRGLVPRHPALRLRGLGRDGEPLDRVVEGFEARIVQHEFDHLNGVLFLDRMRDLTSLAFLDEWHEFLRDPADTGRPSSADKAE